MKYSAEKLNIFWLPLSILLTSITLSLCSSPSLIPVLSGQAIYDLYPASINDLTELANQWTMTGLIDPNQRVFLCDSYILGGPGILQLSAIMERLYTDLPSHNFFSYALRLYAFGNWQSTDNIKLYFDGVEILQWFPSLLPGRASPASCNGYTFTDVFDIGILAHASSSLRITLVSSVPSNTAGVSFGLRGVRIILLISVANAAILSCIEPKELSGIGCGCPSGQYPDSSTPGNCLNCPASCSQCTGQSYPECYGCNYDYYSNGQQCLACTPNCRICSGPNANQCSYCESGYRINWDGTCSLPADPCPSPYTILSSGGFVTCNAACTLSGEFTYQDNSCSATCDTPFIPRIVGTAQFCDGPCSDPSYYYYPSTRLCKPTCPYPYQVDGVNYCIINLDGQDAFEMQTVNSALTAGSYGISVAKVVLSILNAANPSGYSLAMLSEIIQYIRLMKITYPPKLQYMLDQDSSSIDIIPSIPSAVVSKLTNHEMPGKFEEYEDYSSFLANFWQSMIALVLILVGAGISSFLAKKAKGYKYIGWFWQQMKFWLKWNFFLMNMSSSFGDIIVYSSLEFRTYSKDSALDPLSLAMCIFINLFAVLVLARMIHVTIAVRKKYAKSTKRYEYLQEQWEDYSTLYDSFKEKSIFAQGFFIFFIFRLLIFYATIAYLFSYPLVQSIIITCLSLVSLLYIAIIRPFKQIMDFISNLLQELILLTVNVCTLSLAIFDVADKSNYNGRLIPGDIIIYSNSAFNIIGFISMILQIGILLWNIYKLIRRKFSNKVQKDTKISPSTRSNAARGSLPDINLSSDTVAQSSSMHYLNTYSPSRIETPKNSLLQNSKVNIITKPTALPKIKTGRPTMINKESNPRYQDEPPFKKIHRLKKNDSLIRNLYVVNGNMTRLQYQGSNYNHLTKYSNL